MLQDREIQNLDALSIEDLKVIVDWTPPPKGLSTKNGIYMSFARESLNAIQRKCWKLIPRAETLEDMEKVDAWFKLDGKAQALVKLYLKARGFSATNGTGSLQQS